MKAEPDLETRRQMQERRNAILDSLATSTFTPEEYQGIYAELADLALALGPDEDDMAEAKLYQDVRERLSDLDRLSASMQSLTQTLQREHRRWHPKGGDPHGP